VARPSPRGLPGSARADIRLKFRYYSPGADAVHVASPAAHVPSRLEMKPSASGSGWWELEVKVQWGRFRYQHVVVCNGIERLEAVRQFQLSAADPMPSVIQVEVEDVPGEESRQVVVNPPDYAAMALPSSARRHASAETLSTSASSLVLPTGKRFRDREQLLRKLREQVKHLRNQHTDVKQSLEDHLMGSKDRVGLRESVNRTVANLQNNLCIAGDEKEKLREQARKLTDQLARERASVKRLKSDLQDLKQRTRVLVHVAPGSNPVLTATESSVTVNAEGSERIFRVPTVRGDGEALWQRVSATMPSRTTPTVVFSCGGRHTRKSETLWDSGGLVQRYVQELIVKRCRVTLAICCVSGDGVRDLFTNKPVDSNVPGRELKEVVVSDDDVACSQLEAALRNVDGRDDDEGAGRVQHILVTIRSMPAALANAVRSPQSVVHFAELAAMDHRGASKDLTAIGTCANAMLRNLRPLPTRQCLLTQRLESALTKGRCLFVAHVVDDEACVGDASKILRFTGRVVDQDFKGGFKGADQEDMVQRAKELELIIKERERQIQELRPAVRSRTELVDRLQMQVLKAGRASVASPDRRFTTPRGIRGHGRSTRSSITLPRTSSMDSSSGKPILTPRTSGWSRAYSEDSFAEAASRSARTWKDASSPRRHLRSRSGMRDADSIVEVASTLSTPRGSISSRGSRRQTTIRGSSRWSLSSRDSELDLRREVSSGASSRSPSRLSCSPTDVGKGGRRKSRENIRPDLRRVQEHSLDMSAVVVYPEALPSKARFAADVRRPVTPTSPCNQGFAAQRPSLLAPPVSPEPAGRR